MKTFIYSFLFFLLLACEKQKSIINYVVEKKTICTTYNDFGDSAKFYDTFKIIYQNQLPVLQNSIEMYNSGTYKIEINYKLLNTYTFYEN